MSFFWAKPPGEPVHFGHLHLLHSNGLAGESLFSLEDVEPTGCGIRTQNSLDAAERAESKQYAASATSNQGGRPAVVAAWAWPGSLHLVRDVRREGITSRALLPSDTGCAPA